ncbi:MAG: hypothetical protein ABIO78_08595 [Thermoanaerobaculia bacterium]
MCGREAPQPGSPELAGWDGGELLAEGPVEDPSVLSLVCPECHAELVEYEEGGDEG